MEKDLSLWTVAATRKTDAGGEELDGFRLEAALWDERLDNCEFGCMTVGFWASRQAGDIQRIHGGGLDFGLFIMPLGPVRIFPRAKVGLEYRAEPPHDGLGGLFGIGMEGGVWIRDRVFISVTADREFALPSGTTDQVGIGISMGTPEYRWWPE
jgi:hypothetical protein